MLDEEPLLEPLELLDGLLLAPLALEGLELEDGLLLELVLPEPELMPLEEPEVEPEALVCPASHSVRESLPSWSVSSLSNSLEALDEDDVLPEAELGLEELEDDGEDDELLPCDMDGDDEEPELLVESPAA